MQLSPRLLILSDDEVLESNGEGGEILAMEVEKDAKNDGLECQVMGLWGYLPKNSTIREP